MATVQRLTFGERFLDYLVQVSLIVLGLAVATGVDRCNTANRNAARLQDYYTAIQQDLADDLRSNELNINDAERDVAGLGRATALFTTGEPDSLVAGMLLVGRVLQRGVFRTFPPSTFDIMVNTGDIELIDDLELRSQLASVFAFRRDILQQDLEGYNAQVLATVAALGEHVDLSCFVHQRAAIDCIRRPAEFSRRTPDELIMLQLVARRRLFHLQIAQQTTESLLESMSAPAKR